MLWTSRRLLYNPDRRGIYATCKLLKIYQVFFRRLPESWLPKNEFSWICIRPIGARMYSCLCPSSLVGFYNIHIWNRVPTGIWRLHGFRCTHKYFKRIIIPYGDQVEWTEVEIKTVTSVIFFGTNTTRGAHRVLYGSIIQCFSIFLMFPVTTSLASDPVLCGNFHTDLKYSVSVVS